MCRVQPITLRFDISLLLFCLCCLHSIGELLLCRGVKVSACICELSVHLELLPDRFPFEVRLLLLQCRSEGKRSGCLRSALRLEGFFLFQHQRGLLRFKPRKQCLAFHPSFLPELSFALEQIRLI